MQLTLRSSFAIAVVAALPALCVAASAGADSAPLRREAYAYYKGEGVKQSTPHALELFEKAARAGDAESAYDLGKIHEYGMGGVTPDIARATSWYRAAAELGHRNAQFETSIAYYKGQGVAADKVEAAKWWTIAMTPDDAFAQRIRPSVQSAQAKLTPGELAEGQRRAQAWKPQR
jgi:TPR repeat protein